ncbi:hypothetical protein PV04_01219 [Phialophora macrospora]|uniref:Carboxypeptidase n=1 Tax=Phialophora macrospora TaxID=1851006 RepID=A0A0D2EFJ1_9EURO|nr:hypothetical protein PV04_01219 [Phialophora macrospora]
MAFSVASIFLPSLLALVPSIAAVPTSPEGNVIRSLLDPKVSLSYKQTTICETTPGVKSYSGYVNLPANAAEGRNYPTHTFFWFFESRKDPANAPLSLWLQGGPGSPSIPAALGENGPCLVNTDSKSTTLNPWSWNKEVNMLYIDQPVQTGFSYDVLANGTIDEVASPFIVTPVKSSDVHSLDLNTTYLLGTFSSQNPNTTVDTTVGAAEVAWHFMQTWTQQFPKYKPKNNKFSIWTESYGGHWGPTFADYFQSQNSKIASGTLPKSAVSLNLESLGIINGCIDAETQIPLYPVMAYNNTYGLQVINETEYEFGVQSWPACKKLIDGCRSLATEKDPAATGNNAEVNGACATAFDTCFKTMHDVYLLKNRNYFDIAQKYPYSFPPKWAAGYLNSKPVQQDLGVPLNFSANSVPVATRFALSGDFVRGKNLAILGQLLDRGVKVALMYGDRDYQCNWLGGEKISLAVKSQISEKFSKAGYTDIHTNATFVGGTVRQYGNFSFSRVYNAGHEVPYYQPETAYQIFNRVMKNLDISIGKVSTTKVEDYHTTGPSSVFSVKNKLPTYAPTQCYLWDIMETCTKDQGMAFANGTAITNDFIMIGTVGADGKKHLY